MAGTGPPRPHNKLKTVRGRYDTNNDKQHQHSGPMYNTIMLQTNIQDISRPLHWCPAEIGSCKIQQSHKISAFYVVGQNGNYLQLDFFKLNIFWLK